MVDQAMAIPYLLRIINYNNVTWNRVKYNREQYNSNRDFTTESDDKTDDLTVNLLKTCSHARDNQHKSKPKTEHNHSGHVIIVIMSYLISVI